MSKYIDDIDEFIELTDDEIQNYAAELKYRLDHKQFYHVAIKAQRVLDECRRLECLKALKQRFEDLDAEDGNE